MLVVSVSRDRNPELFTSSSMDGRGRGEGDFEENLTKKTVAAVRQLCVDGKITVQQKRKLIFSVIRSTKAAQISQVRRKRRLAVYGMVRQLDQRGWMSSCSA